MVNAWTSTELGRRGTRGPGRLRAWARGEGIPDPGEGDEGEATGVSGSLGVWDEEC
jgi:hypothetical protein